MPVQEVVNSTLEHVILNRIIDEDIEEKITRVEKPLASWRRFESLGQIPAFPVALAEGEPFDDP